MLAIASSLIPIIITILLGYGIKRSAMMKADFWLGAENLTYYILTPALLVSILSNRSLSQLPWHSFLAILTIIVLLCALIICIWHWGLKRQSTAAFTSLFQGGVRYNTFISLALAASLYGDSGLSYAALAATGLIILNNLLCVSMFSISIRTHKFSLRAMAKQIILNPLILGAAIGIFLNLSQIGLHSTLVSSLDLFGRAAFPLGLILVGAALSFKGLKADWELTLISILIQFIFKPLAAIYLINLFSIQPLPGAVILIFMCVPTAPAAYILARKLGGDAPAMAAIITTQTLLAFISMPLTLYWAPQFFN